MAEAEREKVLFRFSILICVLLYIQFVESSQCDEAGKFGWKCRFTCNCMNDSYCDKNTGDCREGCAPGYYGAGCLFEDNYIYGSEQGKNYAGHFGTISDKLQCMNWNDSRISIDKFEFSDLPGPDGPDLPGPYCRNPFVIGAQEYAAKPWCYYETKDGFEFGTCNRLTVQECPDFLYGDTCEDKCHCINVTEVCNKKDGVCERSRHCYPGWRGIRCHLPCPNGKFGESCSHTCGECLYDQCDAETGKCMSGCKAGNKGTYCLQHCVPGEYGPNCAENCGQCATGTCHPKTGNCNGGCKAGYQGRQCLQRCGNGRYGLRCEENCPYCLYRGPCDPETGVCVGGCSPGYQGDSCDQECEDGRFGANCTMACGKCAGASPCDKYTGFCIHGCKEGYDGGECLVAAVVVQEGSVMAGVIAGIVLAVFVIVAIISIFIYRKRRFRRKLIVSGNGDRNIPTTETTLDNIKETSLLLHTTSISGTDGADGDQEDINDSVYDHTTPGHEEPIYVNINPKKLTNPIKVDELQAFVLKSKKNDDDVVKAEHGDLPTGLLALCHTALKAENKIKNRYADIIAYDHSRVVLTPVPHDPNSDYVNASYLDGYNKSKAYIASQGPNKAMLNDFWRMIWQEKVTKIVMLTNLVETCKKKCEQYWPSEGSHTFGEVTIETLDTAEYTDYTIRTFKISVDKISRIIKQFHFTSWTDHGAPSNPTTLLNFRRKVLQYNSDDQGPVLVHCSAGIGRSGTYISVDYLLLQAKSEGVIDLLQCAQLMRSNRVNMIQTWQQYSFVYDAVLEALLSQETTITNSAFPDVYEDICTLNPEESTTKLEDQFEVLQSLSPMIERDECNAATEPHNIHKSRFKNILPANRFRPHLFTQVENCNDFINAVFLPSYTQRDAFIVTQMPLPNTVADFWRLLYDYHSDTVVMLNEFDRNDKSCALYWPEEYGYTVEYGPLSIELLFSSEADTNITVRTFKLTNRNKGEDRAVKQFQFNAWDDYKSVPSGTNALLRLTDAVQEWTRQNGKGPITVHCMNGASKSGLFCASSLVFERMRIDHEVDVYQTVKQMRVNRPHFVENMEQYQFCYQMALAYLERQPIGIDRQSDRQTNDSIDSGIQDKLL